MSSELLLSIISIEFHRLKLFRYEQGARPQWNTGNDFHQAA